MLRPISFTGIKNIGYVRIYTSSPANGSRVCMNMELTDDQDGKDLSRYQNIISENPDFKNDSNDKFVNLEFQTMNVENGISAVNIKMNGKSVLANNDKLYLVRYMKSLADKVARMKRQDFKINENNNFFHEVQNSLIYDEYIDDYLDGSKGRLALFNGSNLTEKFDYYLNDENANLNEDQEEIVFNAVDNVIKTLHEPFYVHKGAVYMSALLKWFSDLHKES